MLTNEQNLFIDVMKSTINKTELTCVPTDIDWDVMLNVGKSQEIKAMLASKVLGFLESESLKPISNDLLNSYASQIIFYNHRMKILAEIEQAFVKANIPFFIFKGSEISELYPTPFLRTMGDSDILVHQEDMEKAHQIFLNLGMTNREKDINEWTYFISNMEFELHCRLMNESEIGSIPSHKEFMNLSWDYAVKESNSVRYHLDWNYHFIFVLLHLRKHFINSGVGFRQFMDIAVMIKTCELDWNWITDKLEKLELTSFAKTCFAFCEKWFGVSVPIELPQLDEDFYYSSTEKIFENGVFGFNSEKNKNNITLLTYRNNTKLEKFRTFIRFIFPSFKEMAASPRYVFLKKLPALLPIAWIYRFFYSLYLGTFAKKTSELNSKLSITKNQISEREEYLNNWGI